jgi:hypothetical protein
MLVVRNQNGRGPFHAAGTQFRRDGIPTKLEFRKPFLHPNAPNGRDGMTP